MSRLCRHLLFIQYLSISFLHLHVAHQCIENIEDIFSPYNSFSSIQKKTTLTTSRLEKSRSQRILWLLEELKLDYELKTYKRQNKLAPPELKEVHPLGKAPIITVESDSTPTPLVFAESGLIIEYLIDHFGSWLAPKRYQVGKDGQVGGETEEWIRYRYFMHYAEGSLMPYLVITLILSRESRSQTKGSISRELY